MKHVLVSRDALDALVASVREPEVPSAAVPEPVVLPPDEKPKLVWGAKVSSTFRDRVYWIGDQITTLQKAVFDPNWLMACMAWETGEKFTADVRNMAGSGATGLIQFMPATAQELGAYRNTTLTTGRLAVMSPEDQLTWVYWYFHMQIKRHGAITNLEDCYMAILWPSAIGKPVSSPLWTKADRPTTYRQNAGLDANKDGTITKLEAADHVRAKLVKGLQFAA